MDIKLSIIYDTFLYFYLLESNFSMAMKQIFPKEIVENTVEVLRFKHKVSSKIIYSILLLSLLVVAIVLPLVRIDVSSSSRGILKTEKERNAIISLYSGKIEDVYMKENEYVKKGDTLIVIDNAIGKEKNVLLLQNFEQVNTFIHDLNLLTSSKKIMLDSIHSFLYQKEYNQFQQKIKELQTKLNKASRDYKRQHKLYKKGVIAKVVHEDYVHTLKLANNNLSYFKTQQQHQWQATLTQQITKKNELESSLQQYNEEQKNYTIVAPINGTIQNLKGLAKGSFITAGELIAELSPDTELIVECYVSPSDIGLLKVNNTVKFQIDAFNYNQWGMATGKIISIQKDISIINDVPLFKVLCAIDQKELALKNGFKGMFKKGMTLNARFFIVNRSAFDLLYDTVDDWFNPASTTK